MQLVMTFVLLNSDPFIRKELRLKLSVCGGLQ